MVTILRSSEIEVETGKPGYYEITVNDIILVTVWAKNKKDSIRNGLLKIFPDEKSWVEFVYNESTTWFHMVQLCIDAETDVESEYIGEK